MSTLFDTGGTYDFYPTTSYMDGDKTFGELDKGDLFIFVSEKLLRKLKLEAS